jgi:hypothetical protein
LATVDALQLEVGDIVSVTHSSPGWSAKPFRITGLSLQPDGNVGVTLQEHQNSVYVWNEGDEVPVYADTTLPDPFQVTAVDVNTVSVASSEAINDNGSSTQRFLVSWTEPSDEFITEYVVQYKESSSASWNGEVKTDSSPIYISGIQSGVAYNVRVKALNAIGVSSAWATLASAVTAANLTTEAGGGNVTYYQNTAPTGDITEGDLWFDTDDDNKPYRWNGSSWISVRDGGIAQAISDAAGAQATADGKVTTFYQNSAPTADGIGDLWIDTDDNNKLYRWSGSAWINVQDGQIATAISDAATAQATADGKIVTFYQTGAPSGASVGDIWFDTDDSNKVYRYNGSSWVAASGTLFGKDEVSENEINLTNDKLADITTDLGAITAGSLNIGSGKFVVDSSGTCTIKSAASGERLEITNDTIKVYDSAGTLRVLIGDLT